MICRSTCVVVPRGAPLPPYIKEPGGGVRPARRGAPGGVLLPPGVGLPPFLVGVGEKERGGEEQEKGGCTPCPIRTRGGPRASFLLASLLYSRMAIQGPYTPRRIPVTLRYSEKYPNHSEPFRTPNIVVQYIDLYVSTISRLLVMSPISSGTPNSFGTSKHVNS